MRNIKRFIPSAIRLNFKLLYRALKDRRSSDLFAKKRHSSAAFPFSISEKQPIKQSSYYQNKIDNIQLGANLIQEILAEPGETISFWKVIGKPSPKRGFKIGRNLVAGKLTADYGGGLCQLSGILYLTALKAGLTITERHNHSLDIYNEEERFTPLGADATIVYGYKDLRLKNTLSHSIRFVFEVTRNSIECLLTSPEKIETKTIHFIAKRQETGVTVETYRDSQLCDVSHYSLLPQ